MNEESKKELFALVLAHVDRVGREATERLIRYAHHGRPDGKLVTNENLHLFRQYRNSVSHAPDRMVDEATASQEVTA